MKKQIKNVIIVIILLVSIFCVYTNLKYEKREVSNSVVTLKENNCYMTTENNITTIQKYNGSVNTIIIDKEILAGNTLAINSDAFLECSNLDTILIDKTIATSGIEIQNFKINAEYEDTQYVEYKNTQNYSQLYQQYLNLSEEEKNKIIIVPDKYDISIDALYTESMEENYEISRIDEVDIPKSFDLRDKINIKVENQWSSPICYAFASLTSVETNLALKHNDYVDLSEHHLASLTYQNGGGSFINANNKYYKEKLGPIYESEWPSNNSEELSAKRYVNETVNIPTINKSYAYTQEEVATTRKIIKTHIMKYGSLYASIFSGIIANEEKVYVLNSEFANIPDHAVSIIGWDDNFAKENFPISNRPNTDGAYLAMNSWGGIWGNNGCFWISYEDHWVESSLRGVISVDTCQENMSIENVIITDKRNNEEIGYKIAKGINAQIAIDANINEIINEQQQITIDVKSPNGEDITQQILIEGNQIENNKAKILLEVNTSKLTTGEYTINLKYEDENITMPFMIKIDTYDFKIKTDGSINITGYYGNDKKIIIPEEFLGFAVSGIESKAFISNELDTVTIYDNITEIGENIIDKSVIIYGNTSTYVQQYANENGYIFIDLNKKIIDGQGWYFDAENHKLVISENTSAKEYDYLKNIIYKVEVKSNVQEIFSYQFQGYENLEEVILADSITSIGANAFRECYNLSTIKLPSNIIKLETEIFYGCEKLQNIEIPEGVATIGDGAFYMCSTLKDINIPNSMKNIGSNAFYRCINLENINIPEGVTSIGDKAFYECISLNDLNIPLSVTNIGNNVFYGSIINKVIQHGTTEIELPDIIKRAINSGDILNCGSDITVVNGKINANENKLEITPGYGQIFITIRNGKLLGLKISIIISGAIEYSENKWTSEYVTATLYVGKGEQILNNGGDPVYKFLENGEFVYEYINLEGENKKVTAKVENIDKTLPAIKTIVNKDEQGFVASVTANISDEQAGLWSKSSIGYAWSTSSTTKPEDWTTIDMPSFVDGIKEMSFEIPISGLSGKYYLWIFKNAFYDMVSNGFEKQWELISTEPYYLGSEPLLQGIKIKVPPTKTTYVEGENFDTQGMKIVEIYHNGTESEITDYKVIDGENLTVDKTFVTITHDKDEETFSVTQGILVEEKLEIISDKYDIQEMYISKIQANTTIEQFKQQISITVGEISIYNKDNELQEDSDFISTGMKIKIKSVNQEKEFISVIQGDTNGDGKADLKDILTINKHRLNKANLVDEYLLAGNVNKDEVVDLKDILLINKFRLGKINEF